MQNVLTNSFRILLAALALLLLAPVAAANNSIVLLVEQPVASNLPLAVATSQSALTNFIKKNGSDAELAIVSYSTTADVLQTFNPITENAGSKIAIDLKNAGARGDDVNTASGMERAIALLNSEAKPNNTKILLVVSDANISTGDPDLDTQFTEWLTEIISEDAVKSGIDVRWHPITQNAKHNNIDAFLEKLNGQRVVLSPTPELINEAAAPLPPSDAEQQLATITSRIASESTNSEVVSNSPATIEEIPDPILAEITETTNGSAEQEVTTATETVAVVDEINETQQITEEIPVAAEPEAVVEEGLIIEPKETPPLMEQPLTSVDTNVDSLSPEPTIEEPKESLLTPNNLKIAALIIIALAASFLLKTLLSNRKESAISGTGLADKEYRDSSDIAVAASSVAAVTTKSNAPIIPQRTPPPTSNPTPTAAPIDKPEPIPTPLGDSADYATSPLVDEEESIGDSSTEDSMDGTQEFFPDFSSASLAATPVTPQESIQPEPQQETETDSLEDLPAEPIKVEVANQSTPAEVDPYATVIAEAPDFAAMAGVETILADEPDQPVQAETPESSSAPEPRTGDDSPAIDPYATVIADASQIQAYAKKFSNEADEEAEDDPDKTVLFQPEKDK